MNTSVREKQSFFLNTSAVRNSHRSNISLIAITCLFFVIILAFPDVSARAVKSSLTLCFYKLIPSLFPFMILGDMFFSFGAGEVAGRLLGKPFNKLFGISENGVGAFVLGAVCGLPLGAKYALKLYENGDISKSDCERLMGISTNAGLGFVTAGVGVATFGSARFGIALYLCQIAAAVICGVLQKSKPNIQTIAPVTRKNSKKQFSIVFTSAVSDSTLSLLKICGFAVFFGVLTEFLRSAAILFSLPPLFFATISAFPELTSACEILHTFSLSNAPVTLYSAHILTFFAVGFCGFCVHFQVASFVDGYGISMRRYYLTKLLSGVICALLGAAVLHFIPLL